MPPVLSTERIAHLSYGEDRCTAKMIRGLRMRLWTCSIR
jgi:hypothetical protein